MFDTSKLEPGQYYLAVVRGKHVATAVVNTPAPDLPDEAIALLVRDVYELADVEGTVARVETTLAEARRLQAEIQR